MTQASKIVTQWPGVKPLSHTHTHTHAPQGAAHTRAIILMLNTEQDPDFQTSELILEEGDGVVIFVRNYGRKGRAHT